MKAHNNEKIHRHLEHVTVARNYVRMEKNGFMHIARNIEKYRGFHPVPYNKKTCSDKVLHGKR